LNELDDGGVNVADVYKYWEEEKEGEEEDAKEEGEVVPGWKREADLALGELKSYIVILSEVYVAQSYRMSNCLYVTLCMHQLLDARDINEGFAKGEFRGATGAC
jgi:hypothetical protein